MKAILVVFGVLGLWSGLSFAQAADRQPPRPNVVFILADDLGFSDLGCYGSEIKTPQLDALAAGGLRFTQMYNTGRCWPSRASLLTGYYPQAVRRDAVEGIPSGSNGVRPSWARLLPELLKPLGYRSYHSGKWHIDGQPLKCGFERSYEIGGGQNNYFSTKGITDDERPVAQTDEYYVTTAVADHAIDCLKEHAAQHSEQPFFQYVCFTAPHFPLHAPGADVARYRERYVGGWDVLQRERYDRLKELGLIAHDLPAVERKLGPPYPFPQAMKILGAGEVNRPLAWTDLTPAQRDFQANKMAVHAAMVDRMDREIGRIVQQLKDSGTFNNTLIMFASDNGASAEIMVRGEGHDPQAAPGSAETYLCLGPGWSSAANTPFRRHKTWVHEGGILTPFIAHWPAGIVARGDLRESAVHFVDIVPAVLELAGGNPPKTLEGSAIPAAPGISLVPLLARDGAVKHEYLWWHHNDNRAFRQGNWKLVSAGKAGPWELYDLSQDRGETKDLAATQHEKVRELSALWQEKSNEFGALARQSGP